MHIFGIELKGFCFVREIILKEMMKPAKATYAEFGIEDIVLVPSLRVLLVNISSYKTNIKVHYRPKYPRVNSNKLTQSILVEAIKQRFYTHTHIR